jgi:hypothetical protein
MASIKSGYDAATFPTDADLSSAENLLVKFDSGDLVLATAVTDNVVGIVIRGNDGSTTADFASVAISGCYKVKAGGAITAGALLTATTGGEAIATTTAEDNVFAIALDAADDGDLCPVALRFSHYHA